MELVEHLVQKLGVSPRQALGGAGLLLQLVQRRMTDEEFLELAESLPAISDVIGKAPRVAETAAHPVLEKLNRWCGGLGPLNELSEPFENLGYDKKMIPRVVDALLDYFQQHGHEGLATKLSKILR